MCVIFVAMRTRPTEEMVRKAWAANDDGAGIAWRETNNNKVEVVWKKGIEDVEEILELTKTVPLPFVAHFRIASCGGIKQSLTHPFLVNAEASTALEGRTNGLVLFHNGHWSDWDKEARMAAYHSGSKVPKGDWSDTRAMAWLTHHHGPHFMEFLPSQRGVLFGPNMLDIFTGNGWTKINEVWCSNDLFTHRRTGFNSGNTNQVYTGRLCRNGKCTKAVLPGKDWCYEHDPDKVTATPKLVTGGNNTPPAASGGAAAVAPFVPVEVLTIKQAEVLFRMHKITKSMLKKIKKTHDQAANKGPKALKAYERLKELSQIAQANLVTGRVH